MHWSISSSSEWPCVSGITILRGRDRATGGKSRACRIRRMKIACAFASLLLLLTPLAPDARAEWVEHPGAIQTVYQAHVPHTDRNGRRLESFNKDKSFFPLALYHAL